MKGLISLIATASVAMAATAAFGVDTPAATPAKTSASSSGGAAPALPAVPQLGVTVSGLDPKGRIPQMFAFCTADPVLHTKDGGNVSPEISWVGTPKDTQSFAIIMHDPDVPTSFDDANQTGHIISADLPRKVFYHWALVDIDPHTTRLPAGADSDRPEKTGKHTQHTRFGLRGLNSFGSFLGGEFYGYDGPCPPWNDAIVHHYIFTVYALDVRSLNLSGGFDAEDVKKAMEGHILAKGTATGIYTQNPALLR